MHVFKCDRKPTNDRNDKSLLESPSFISGYTGVISGILFFDVVEVDDRRTVSELYWLESFQVFF